MPLPHGTSTQVPDGSASRVDLPVLIDAFHSNGPSRACVKTGGDDDFSDSGHAF
jgi:hypothetical protein